MESYKLQDKKLSDLSWTDMFFMLKYLSNNIDLEPLIKKEPKLRILLNQEFVNLDYVDTQIKRHHKSLYKDIGDTMSIENFLNFCWNDPELDDGSVHFIDEEGYVIIREEEFPFINSETDVMNWIKENPEVKEAIYFSK